MIQFGSDIAYFSSKYYKKIVESFKAKFDEFILSILFVLFN